MKNLQSTLSWEIEQSPIYANNKAVKGYKAITRNDNGDCLNVAKSTYTATPNSRLIDVTQRLSEMTGFEPAGYSEFKNGRLVLSYLKSTEGSQILDWDMEDYMVIGNSHDGTTGFFIGTSSVMLRCQNQFSKVSQKLRAYHTKNNDIRIEELLSYFQTYKEEHTEIIKKMEEFHKIKIDEKIITALAERLFRIEEGTEEALLSTRKANLITEFKGSLEREFADLGHNLHGLFNGVTHYTTHVQKTKDKVFGNVVGQAAKMNAKAFAFCDSLLLNA